LDAAALEELVPELSLARGVEQGPYHHLDVLDHILETIRGIDRELDERRLEARVDSDRVPALRVAALLHDIAKPLTRGESDDRIIFVAHDSLGARLAHRVCRRLGLSAAVTDLAVNLTALHLKIGFMGNPRSDHPPERLIKATGPFGEELAVLCWSDRLAAQGPRLKPEHIERHRELCAEFLTLYRKAADGQNPDYEDLAKQFQLDNAADAGYAASRVRALEARGLGAGEAVQRVRGPLSKLSAGG
jgi:poly(A) polymerase